MNTKRPRKIYDEIESSNLKNNFEKIITLLKEGDPDKESFEEQKDEFYYYSSQINKQKNVSELLSLLEEMSKNNLYPDTVIFNQLIIKLRYAGKKYININDVYDIVVSKNLANVVTHNNMIDAAGKNGRIDLAENAYQNALDAGIADVRTHSIMISVAGKCGQFKLAKKIYNKTLADNIADVVTCASMIDAAGKNDRVDIAETVYQKTLNEGIANGITHNSMINAAGNCRRIDLAEIAYNNAMKARMADAITHNSMINAAGNCSRIDLAEIAYNNAFAARSVNVRTHNIMINAAGKNDRVDLAQKAYNNALKNGVANVRTHSIMIDAAEKTGRIDLAKSAYNNAIKDKVANQITHYSMISALVLDNQLQNAKAIYDTRQIEWPITKTNNSYTIDLHDASYGVAYIVLSGFIERHRKENPNIKIIYGKGLHSQTNEDIHPVKKAVQKVISDKNLAPFFKENELNSGQGFINFQNENELTQNNANRFSPKLFPSASVKSPVSQAKSPPKIILNPNAQVFKPSNTQSAKQLKFSNLSANAPVFVPGSFSNKT